LQVKEMTRSIQKTHVEQYSAVKDLDFVCLLDVTGSMEKYIDGVKDNINAVQGQITSK
jgi:hypothetical protein